MIGGSYRIGLRWHGGKRPRLGNANGIAWAGQSGRCDAGRCAVLVLPFDLVSILFSHSQLPRETAEHPVLPNLSRHLRAQLPRAAEFRPTKASAQGKEEDTESTLPNVPRLQPLVVTAPATMSLAAPDKPKLADVRVAAILDEMSHDCFAPECQL